MKFSAQTEGLYYVDHYLSPITNTVSASQILPWSPYSPSRYRDKRNIGPLKPIKLHLFYLPPDLEKAPG
jgi:hypothetical protein